MNATGVDLESELHAPDRVYYPSALPLAPTLPQLPMNPSPAFPSSAEQKDLVPSPTSSKGKETTKEPPPSDAVVDVEAEKEVPEGEPLKKKEKKKQEKKGVKEKEPKA